MATGHQYDQHQACPSVPETAVRMMTVIQHNAFVLQRRWCQMLRSFYQTQRLLLLPPIYFWATLRRRFLNCVPWRLEQLYYLAMCDTFDRVGTFIVTDKGLSQFYHFLHSTLSVSCDRA